jgi:hypothetical protein
MATTFPRGPVKKVCPVLLTRGVSLPRRRRRRNRRRLRIEWLRLLRVLQEVQPAERNVRKFRAAAVKTAVVVNLRRHMVVLGR